MIIDILQENGSNTPLLSFETDKFVPLVGDQIAGGCFKDGYQRTIVRRLIFPNTPNYLNVYATYTFPNLVKTLNTITEQDLVTVKS